MLQAAAERGVKVNVIVYKEVEKVLTRKLLYSNIQYILLYFIKVFIFCFYKIFQGVFKEKIGNFFFSIHIIDHLFNDFAAHVASLLTHSQLK